MKAGKHQSSKQRCLITIGRIKQKRVLHLSSTTAKFDQGISAKIMSVFNITGRIKLLRHTVNTHSLFFNDRA